MGGALCGRANGRGLPFSFLMYLSLQDCHGCCGCCKIRGKKSMVDFSHITRSAHLGLKLLINFITIRTSTLLCMGIHPVPHNNVIGCSKLAPGSLCWSHNRTYTSDGSFGRPHCVICQILQNTVADRDLNECIRVPTLILSVSTERTFM